MVSITLTPKKRPQYTEFDVSHMGLISIVYE